MKQQNNIKLIIYIFLIYTTLNTTTLATESMDGITKVGIGIPLICSSLFLYTLACKGLHEIAHNQQDHIQGTPKLCTCLLSFASFFLASIGTSFIISGVRDGIE